MPRDTHVTEWTPSAHLTGHGCGQVDAEEAGSGLSFLLCFEQVQRPRREERLLTGEELLALLLADKGPQLHGDCVLTTHVGAVRKRKPLLELRERSCAKSACSWIRTTFSSESRLLAPRSFVQSEW